MSSLPLLLAALALHGAASQPGAVASSKPRKRTANFPPGPPHTPQGMPAAEEAGEIFFDKYDANGDGVVSRDEVTQMLPSMTPPETLKSTPLKELVDGFVRCILSGQ